MSWAHEVLSDPVGDLGAGAGLKSVSRSTFEIRAGPARSARSFADDEVANLALGDVALKLFQGGLGIATAEAAGRHHRRTAGQLQDGRGVGVDSRCATSLLLRTSNTTAVMMSCAFDVAGLPRQQRCQLCRETRHCPCYSVGRPRRNLRRPFVSLGNAIGNMSLAAVEWSPRHEWHRMGFVHGCQPEAIRDWCPKCHTAQGALMCNADTTSPVAPALHVVVVCAQKRGRPIGRPGRPGPGPAGPGPISGASGSPPGHGSNGRHSPGPAPNPGPGGGGGWALAAPAPKPIAAKASPPKTAADATLIRVFNLFTGTSMMWLCCLTFADAMRLP